MKDEKNKVVKINKRMEIPVTNDYTELMEYIESFEYDELLKLEKQNGFVGLLIDAISSKYPKDSIQYCELMEVLRQGYFSNKYGDEFVLGFNESRDIDEDIEGAISRCSFAGLNALYYNDKEFSQLNKIIGADDSKYTRDKNRYLDNSFETIRGYFNSEKKSFYDDTQFINDLRSIMEYNPGIKQIVVGLVIKCGPNIILMQNKGNFNDMGKSLSLISGHVSFSNHYYSYSKNDYLKMNLLRELEEETTIETNLTKMIPNYPKFIIHDSSPLPASNISFYHIGLIYELDISSIPLDQVKFLIKAKEEGTEVGIYNLVEFDMDSHKNADNWVRSIISYYKRFHLE